MACRINKETKFALRCFESFGTEAYLENCEIQNVSSYAIYPTCVSTHISLSRTIGAQIFLCTSDHRGYVHRRAADESTLLSIKVRKLDD